MAKKYYLDGRVFKPRNSVRVTTFVGQEDPVSLNDIIEEVVGISLPVVPATTTVQGIVELATNAEAIAKASTTVVLTPSNLAALGASETFAGLVELATDAEAIAGVSTTVVITPANLTAALATAGDLESVLTNGNNTGANDIELADNQFIKAENGGGRLDLRSGADNSVALTTDGGNFAEGWLGLYPTYSTLGMGANYTTVDATNVNGFLATGASYMGYQAEGLTTDLTTVNYNIAVNDNTAGAVTFAASVNGAVSINSGSAGNVTTVNAGIDNSASIGGIGITVKTANTAYANQLGLCFNGSAFETIIDTAVLTADRTAEFPDASGIISIIRTVTTAINYAAQNGEIVLGTSGGGGITVTLPDATGKDNMQVTVKKVDAGVGAFNIDSAGGLIDGAAGAILVAQYNTLQFTSNGGAWWVTGAY